jgi:hypothetical protein
MVMFPIILVAATAGILASQLSVIMLKIMAGKRES